MEEKEEQKMEDVEALEMDKEGKKEKVVLMWGYLPGATPEKSALLSPVKVTLPEMFQGDKWKDVSGGGCGFAMATTEIMGSNFTSFLVKESGKLITWGSNADQGQSYLTSGKHEEVPGAFPMPANVSVAKAIAGWAHCITVTDQGNVYAWGWKECVPSGKVSGAQSNGHKNANQQEHIGAGKVTGDESNCTISENDTSTKENGSLDGQGIPAPDPTHNISKICNGVESRANHKGGEESKKRRRLSAAKKVEESSATDESDEPLSEIPCLVTIGIGVQITAVAAGGRHTLALADDGQVWGWGYGGEGQLGLGTRIRMLSSPHPILFSKRDSNCIEANGVSGSKVKAIACGGRHSAVVTDTGALFTFGWGLHGQCGHGGTDDELSPTCVSSLLGVKIRVVAAGLWHTVCTSADGGVYAFGANQFGQLATGSDQVETLPKLLEAPCLEKINAKSVSCGARHSTIVTDEGKVFCWGWNKYGQLGLGDATDRCSPCEVPLEGFIAKEVSCGWWHTLVLAEPIS